jgi:Resolvase, N terminal domain
MPRVSSDAQDLTSQLAQLRAAGCKSKNIFREKITGTTADRPQLGKLMKKLAPGDVVIIPAVDRLSRDTTDLLVIARDARRAGAGIRSLAEPGLLRSGNARFQVSASFEGNVVAKAKGGIGDDDRTRRQLSLVRQVQLIVTDLIRTEQLRRLTKMTGEQRDVRNIRSPGVRSQVPSSIMRCRRGVIESSCASWSGLPRSHPWLSQTEPLRVEHSREPRTIPPAIPPFR